MRHATSRLGDVMYTTSYMKAAKEKGKKNKKEKGKEQKKTQYEVV